MKTLLFLILLSLISFDVLSQTIYVSTTGNNQTGDGSEANPYASVSFAASKALPGSTIFVEAGTYTESSTINLRDGVNLSGAGREVTIINSNVQEMLMRAEDGSTPHFIRNLTFTGSNLFGLRGISFYRRSNVEVYDCEFRDFKYFAVNFRGWRQEEGQPLVFATGNKFYRNRVINCSQRANEDGTWAGGGMVCLQDQDGFEFFDNYLDQSMRDSMNGNTVYGVGGHIKGAKMYNNISIKDNQPSRVPFPDANGNYANWHWEFWNGNGGNEIYNNKFYGGAMGIDVAGGIGNFKGDYDFAWLIKGNEFSMEEQSHNTTGWLSMGVNIESYTDKIIVDSNYFKNLEDGMHIIGTHAMVGANSDSIFVTRNIFENIGRPNRPTRGYNIMIGVDHDDVKKNIFIYNNTFVRTKGPYAVQNGIEIHARKNGNQRGRISNVYIRNNIMMNTTEAYLVFWEWEGIMDSIFSENNILYDNARGNTYYRRANNELGYVREANNIIADPLLNPDLSLSANSPAIGAGIDLGFGTDIGAIPYTSPSTNLSIAIPGGNRSTTQTTVQLSSTVTGGSGHYSFLWEKISGGSAILDNEFSQTINVSGLQNGTYVFRCTVIDSNNETAQAEVTVTVTEEEPPYHEGQLRLRGRVRIVEYRNQ